MDDYADSWDSPVTVARSVRLPDRIEPGRYNAVGQADPGGNVFIGVGSGIVHIWATFPGGLAPGQRGDMTFLNAPGSYAVTGNFTAWSPGPAGPSPHAEMHKEFGEPRGPFPPQHLEAGVWDITVQVFERPGEPPQIVQGVETNILMPTVFGPGSPVQAYLIKTYAANFHGLPFEIHEIWGPGEPNSRLAEGQVPVTVTSVKTQQANLATFHGVYDADQRILRLEGTVQNCFGKINPATGKVYMVQERREIKYVDSETKDFRVWQTSPPEDPKETTGSSKVKGAKKARPPKDPFSLRDHSVGRKRRTPGSGDTNVPRLGGAPMSLVALQRGRGAVRVVGQNDGDARIDAAAGMIMLGPPWLAFFGETLRL